MGHIVDAVSSPGVIPALSLGASLTLAPGSPIRFFCFSVPFWAVLGHFVFGFRGRWTSDGPRVGHRRAALQIGDVPGIWPRTGPFWAVLGHGLWCKSSIFPSRRCLASFRRRKKVSLEVCLGMRYAGEQEGIVIWSSPPIGSIGTGFRG